MSHILSRIIKQKLPQWNERIFTLNDIPLLGCETKVGIVEAAIKHRGEYTIYDGVPFIIVRKNLRDPMKLWVSLHEIGHHLLHYPTSHKFSKSVNSKADREANFFTAIAMMPTALCRTRTPAEVLAEFDYPRGIVEIRLEISEHFRI